MTNRTKPAAKPRTKAIDRADYKKGEFPNLSRADVLADADAAVAHLEAVLTTEWVDYGDGELYCPSCENDAPSHLPNCRAEAARAFVRAYRIGG